MNSLVRQSRWPDRAEEYVNAITHGLGVVLAAVATVLLVRTIGARPARESASMIVYGISLLVLYLASTIYHIAWGDRAKKFLRRIDHSAIFLLIAGTYTPFAVIVLAGTTAAWVLAVEWGLATIGIVLSLFFRRYRKTWQQVVFVVIYLIMGWLVLPILRVVVESLGAGGFRWLLAGGIFYTAGIVFYSLRRVRFAHSIWHLFVMAGSAAHFVVVYAYL